LNYALCKLSADSTTFVTRVTLHESKEEAITEGKKLAPGDVDVTPNEYGQWCDDDGEPYFSVHQVS